MTWRRADWATATAAVTPFLQGWLGQRPRAQLTVLDLPDSQDAPFETGALLVTAIRQASPEQLNGIMAHALTHCMDAVAAGVAERGRGALYGHALGGEAAGPRDGAGEPGGDARGAGAGRAGEPGAKRRAAAGRGDFADLLSHQGDLCVVDAARLGRRAARSPPRCGLTIRRRIMAKNWPARLKSCWSRRDAAGSAVVFRGLGGCGQGPAGSEH